MGLEENISLVKNTPQKPVLEIDNFQEALENFFGALNGAKLENSDGKIITITINKENNKPDKKSLCRVLEFEGYLGEDRKGNYILFLINHGAKSIVILRAQLTSEDLKGKNVYPKIVKLIGEKFPDDFSLEAIIGNPKEHRKGYRPF